MLLTVFPSRRPKRVPITRPAASWRLLWWSKTWSNTIGWTMTLVTASTPSSSKRAGEEGDEAGARLVIRNLLFKRGLTIKLSGFKDTIPGVYTAGRSRATRRSHGRCHLNGELLPSSVLLPFWTTRCRTNQVRTQCTPCYIHGLVRLITPT